MTPRFTPATGRLIARLAVAGLTVAFLALGALAVWAALVTQNGAQDLSRAGVQTSGHVRALQALSTIDTQTDALEDGADPAKVRTLRQAQALLREALGRMKRGGVPEQVQIAEDVGRAVVQLEPAIDRFLAAGVGSGAQSESEEAMEEIMEEAQLRLNDLGSDPSGLLAAELDAVTDSERAVRWTTLVLVPAGLLFVALCAWLINGYRRRSEAAMREAMAFNAREARTDQLTGLANRRALLEELERGIHDGFVLALADLNGFKHYNDTYGHAAGDSLLRRLGGKLVAACEGRAFAARLGGDEFCVLVPRSSDLEGTRRLVEGALREEGHGFSITAACGVVSIPDEAHDTHSALRLADVRMYAAKPEARPSVDHLMSRVLLQMLEERHPGLGDHGEVVADLAATCAATLGLAREDVEHVRRAAELHDIGKFAIPESIVSKPGPLDEEEWEFMRRHPVIGERVLVVVPSLQPVAALVRSSHERWDGQGYPDHLTGEAIPIGARILAVADAFCAMTEERSYASARSVEGAIDELRACAGTQFDPDVVDAFVSILTSRLAAPALAA